MTSKVQTVSGNNGAAATTTVAATPAATQQFSTLIAAICCAVASAVITAPAGSGWVQVGSVATTPAGGTVALFKWEQNPGAISSAQTFTITSSLASIVISEYNGLPPLGLNVDSSSSNASANGASAVLPSIITSAFGELIVVALGYVNNTALVLTLPVAGLTQDGSNISTAASANGAIHLLSNLGSSISPVSGSITLSGTPTDGPSVVAAAVKNYVLETSNGNVGPNTYSGQ